MIHLTSAQLIKDKEKLIQQLKNGKVKSKEKKLDIFFNERLVEEFKKKIKI